MFLDSEATAWLTTTINPTDGWLDSPATDWVITEIVPELQGDSQPTDWVMTTISIQSGTGVYIVTAADALLEVDALDPAELV